MLILAALSLSAYQIIDLDGPPDAEKVMAVAINNRGEVLLDAGGEGYLWRAGKLRSLGKPADPTKEPTTRPTALNDLSVAVGTYGSFTPMFMSGLTDCNPFIWRGKGLEEFGGPWAATPLAINNLGDIVGVGDHRGFVRLQGTVYGLGTLSHASAGNFSSAVDINDHRLIVGNSTYGGGRGVEKDLPSRPFTVDGNGPLRLRPVPLPKGYLEGYAHAVSNAGTILAVAGSGPHEGALPYLVRRGRVVELPFAGEPLNVMNASMNEREEVVATVRDFVHPERGRPHSVETASGRSCRRSPAGRSRAQRGLTIEGRSVERGCTTGRRGRSC